MKVVASICFPDEREKHMATLRNLLDFYIDVEGLSGDTLVDVEYQDGNLVIEVNKGFHCISIPLIEISKFLPYFSKEG